MRRKKWPHYAEWARLDAIAMAREIRKTLNEVKALVAAGNNSLLAVAILSDCIEAVRDIEDKLKEAGNGKRGGND